MNLLIDIGHSRIKWSLYDSSCDTFTTFGAMYYHEANLPDLFAHHWGNIIELENVLIADVSSDKIAESCNFWFAENYHVKAVHVKTQNYAHGMRNAYLNPSRLGVDRWLAMLAGWYRFRNDKAAMCVVDCGTAITVDGISDAGLHLGGLILPGFTLAHSSLADGVRGIRCAIDEADHMDSHSMPPYFYNTTKQAIHGGYQFAVIATIDSIVTAMQNKFGQTVHRLLTGGDAKRVLGLTKTEFEHDPKLVLRGLALHLTAQP